MSPSLELSAVEVMYGAQTVVKGVSLRLARGKLGCLLGPSGCGKTTLLRAIAGFEPVAKGAIHIDGAKVSSPAGLVPPEERQVGVVFQDYALFPHLTVADNIAFGLHGVSPPERRARVIEMLTLVGLTGVEGRHPHQLSGGQQQRVALARAIAPCPRLLLIDEPFSSLDAEMRERLSHELRRIVKEAGITALLVTHDQNEAFVMADEIGVMAAGQLQQWADAETLYQRPASRFVAQFIGHGAVLRARVGGAGDLLHTALGDFLAPRPVPLPEGGRYVEILVRPEQIRLRAGGKDNVTVTRRAFRGADVLYSLRLDDGQEIQALAPPASRYAPGERLNAVLEIGQPVIVAGEGG
jgi:iron(III) transport system ATP-binding protein